MILRLEQSVVQPNGIPWAITMAVMEEYRILAEKGLMPIAEELATDAWYALWDLAAHESYAERLGIDESALTLDQRDVALQMAEDDYEFSNDVSCKIEGFTSMYEGMEGIVLEILKVNNLAVATFILSDIPEGEYARDVHMVNIPQVYVFEDERRTCSALEDQYYFHSEYIYPEILIASRGEYEVERWQYDY